MSIGAVEGRSHQRALVPSIVCTASPLSLTARMGGEAAQPSFLSVHSLLSTHIKHRILCRHRLLSSHIIQCGSTLYVDGSVDQDQCVSFRRRRREGRTTSGLSIVCASFLFSRSDTPEVPTNRHFCSTLSPTVSIEINGMRMTRLCVNLTRVSQGRK